MEWRADITAAAERIAGHIIQTPTFDSAAFGTPRPVSLKAEHTQHTGSFKARGAFNTLISKEVPEAGVVAASGGNHGAAVAYAARQLGYPAKIFVPEIAGPSKIALIERTGADLTVVPGQYADAMAMAERYEAEKGAMQVHAYDATPTVSGQGTMMREWEIQAQGLDTVLIAVGGGGLIAGALAWLQGSKKVVAVEPETSKALNAALEAGAPVDVPVSGVAANALGARKIGQICFDLSVQHQVHSITVPDPAIITAQEQAWQAHRMLLEPAGATALAALLHGAYVPGPDERVGVLLCGGNIAPDPLAG